MSSRELGKLEPFFWGGEEDGSSFYTKNIPVMVLQYLEPVKELLASAIGKLYGGWNPMLLVSQVVTKTVSHTVSHTVWNHCGKFNYLVPHWTAA